MQQAAQVRCGQRHLGSVLVRRGDLGPTAAKHVADFIRHRLLGILSHQLRQEAQEIDDLLLA
ncbi:hypothetical protein D5047_13105 [Verminephrobacter eiseniae]|nr:hypothetical protein [Verminephrobacter eiseniae]